MRMRYTLGVSLLFLAGCEMPSCNFHFGCQDDGECASNEVCEYTVCKTAQPCDNGVCPEGASCVQRPDIPAGNPFESPTPGKHVCECYGSYKMYNCPGYSEGGYGGGGTGGYGGGATGGAGGGVGCLSAPPSGELVSVDHYGDAEESGGALLALADQGDAVVVAVPFKGTIDLGDGPMISHGDTDVAIAFRYQGGSPLWTTSLGTAGPDVLTALGSVAGEPALAMSFTGTLDVAGKTLDSGAGAAAVVVATDGNGVFKDPLLLTSDQSVTVTSVSDGEGLDRMTVAGTFRGQLHVADVTLTGAGGTDGFVLRVQRSTGAVLWSYQLGGAGDQEITAALIDDNGKTHAVGSILDETTLGGATTLTDGRDGLVVTLDGVGLEVSHRVIGGPDRQVVSAMALGPTGSLFVAGARASESQSAGSIDFGGGGVTLDGSGLVDTFVAKLDGDFEVPWAVLLAGAPGTGEIIPRAIAYDCANQVTVVGQATGGAGLGAEPAAGYGKYDAFACKIENGTVVWGKLFGGPEDDQATGVAPLGGKVIELGGSFAGVASFGGTELTSAGADDTFLVTLKP